MPWQSQEARLLPIARSAEDARVMLEALEAGTDGVVLHTQEPAQASSLHQLHRSTIYGFSQLPPHLHIGLLAGTDRDILMQVRELAAWVQQQRSSRAGHNTFDIAEVVRIQSVGMGDR